VDTGSQTTLVDPALATKLRLHPEFRVEIITQNSTRVLPALKMKSLRIGDKRIPEIEVVIHKLDDARRFDPNVVGVLGMNGLVELDFGLLHSAGTLAWTRRVRPV
jgi:hypothetical protein